MSTACLMRSIARWRIEGQHMTHTSDFLLPDPGEGLTEAEIVEWRVAPGDSVAINQVLVEIETAKSLVELPSPFEGVVEALLVSVGDTVAVGSPIITVSKGGATDAKDAAADDGESGAVLVGYGTRGAAVSRRGGRAGGGAVRASDAVPAGNGAAAGASSVKAKPPVRKLAKDLGVDLKGMAGTGR